MTLDKITAETCVHKVRALKSAYVPKTDEICRNGCVNNEECPRYVPVGRTQERYAYLNLYGGREE